MRKYFCFRFRCPGLHGVQQLGDRQGDRTGVGEEHEPGPGSRGADDSPAHCQSPHILLRVHLRSLHFGKGTSLKRIQML